MCGIAGLIDLKGRPVDGHALVRMTRRMAHRGPDGEGFAVLASNREACRFLDEQALADGCGVRNAGFGHRRLAIIDLSEAGTQPMCNKAGDVWITYNGEVFNYVELRRELEDAGRTFRTATDTEVLIQAYEEWGTECLHRLNGMWAFAIWDTRNRRLVCARDRFGIKPFYYAERDGVLAFASEPKALLELPWVSREPDERAVADYLVHSREDCFEWTFFRDIKRLAPGTLLEVDVEACVVSAPRQWWRIEDTLLEPPADDGEAQSIFRELFESAVRLRLRSDVPVGTCLSGGLDSSAVLCVARPWLEPQNQKSYSAVYDASFEEDETRFVDQVIDATGVENFRVHPTGESLAGELDSLVECQDEPFGSTSQYAQMKVFELVRQNGTTVTLDGQGSDEELAGYVYFYPAHFAQLIRSRQPGRALREMSAYRHMTGAGLLRTLLSAPAGFLSHRSLIRWANRYDPSRSIDWVAPHVRELAATIEQPPAVQFPDLLNRRLYEVFAVSSLPALLRYEDRNSMAYGVEARLPFLDHRLVSFLFSLPSDQKIRNGWAKHVMRESLKGVIPETIRTRTDKIGFATPEAQWFRSTLLGRMREEFSSARVRNRGLFDTDRLLPFLERNAGGKVNAGRALWRALNLELWFRRYVD